MIQFEISSTKWSKMWSVWYDQTWQLISDMILHLIQQIGPFTLESEVLDLIWDLTLFWNWYLQFNLRSVHLEVNFYCNRNDILFPIPADKIAYSVVLIIYCMIWNKWFPLRQLQTRRGPSPSIQQSCWILVLVGFGDDLCCCRISVGVGQSFMNAFRRILKLLLFFRDYFPKTNFGLKILYTDRLLFSEIVHWWQRLGTRGHWGQNSRQ